MNVEDDSNELKKMFFQEKPVDMIVSIKLMNGSYASELSEKCDTTYSHSVKVMNRFQELGLVDWDKKGRKKEYRLTDRGEKLADELLTIFDDVEGMERPLENANGGSISEIVS